ncbi:cupin domain-containing protein [Cryptosporangium aurantiacum]|uniref:Cupin domain-containing protein n=1 Tax=Cryptosporangium aurantiacum TaxID=134849 RepID=A0A1M7REC8_9ACTN|nr:cupin domain-containing protein [Cryptosporangium aurantiacum]SHN44499.1 Cupin domain-containing protein [Cryptosporangium aurantiacum]
MPVLQADSAVTHEVHGSRFTSYVRPAVGSAELCAWRLDVPAGTTGVPHRPSREEVLVILSGSAEVTLDGEVRTATAGDVVLVPAGASFRVDVGDEPLRAWVTTSVGLTAELPDGSTLTPPWAA